MEINGTGFIKSHGKYKERSEKSQCIDANYHKGADNHGQRTLINNPAAIVGRKLDENGKHHRKLTPIECERLQTVPDNYTNHVSNTQRYKMLGNGWTVDVIAHIFKAGLL